MIRKQNSDFVTAFTSESGGNIKNSDSFAFVELEGFACYILADGIDDVSGASSAKICVDAIVTAFTEQPSMKKSKLKKYMRLAQIALDRAKTKDKLKASVTILVHNYVKMRYCQAGNVRFRLYRNGFLKYESKDHSLSKDLVETHKLEKDKLLSHAERHNLYSYVGQEATISPWVSKKFKMTSSDAISLTTRGFWENMDDGELLDLFQDATTDPRETVRTAEDMLLSKQPEHLRAFTFATIFVNKTFKDPTKRQKWKKFWTFAIPILILCFILCSIFYSRWRTKQNNIATMHEYFSQSVAYMDANNYIRGEGSLENAITFANKVKDTEMVTLATQYLMLVQRVISADNYLEKNDFQSAYTAYVDSLNLSRKADLYAASYVLERLELTSNYISIFDLISLGDTLALNTQYTEAEVKYLEAKVLAGKIYYDSGRQNAMNALENLYELQKSEMEEMQGQAVALVELQTSVANFVAQGDTAFTSGDFESALVFYTSAIQKYGELGDEMNLALAEEKLKMTKEKQLEAIEQRETAENYISLGDSEKNIGNYNNTRKFYLLAKDVYSNLGDSTKVTEVQTKIEIVDLLESTKLAEDLAQEEALKEKEEAIQVSLELEQLKAELQAALEKVEEQGFLVAGDSDLEEEVAEEKDQENDVKSQNNEVEEDVSDKKIDLPKYPDDVIILG